MRTAKGLLFFLILLVLSAPALHLALKVIREPDLHGYYHQTEPPSLDSLNWKRWFSSVFQDPFATRVNDYSGLRKSLIRINNQYDFTLYGLTHARGFILGKSGYLFEEDYIHEYNGDYFIGRAAIDKKLSRLKNVSDSLRAHNIPLILVYEPGKASFFPEYIPGRFHPESKRETNSDYFIRRSRQLGLSFTDLNSYFLAMKDTARHPLFPRYGMHWSLYAVPFAVDTLSRLIESETGKQLPDFKTSNLATSMTPKGTDNDIGELLNLACPLKPTPGAYPSIVFQPGAKKSVSALVIADSYYVNIVEDYGSKLFKTQDYWYYNNKLYPYQNNDPPRYVDKSDLRAKLETYDVVLLMVSEINLHCGFWNFADESFLAFHPEKKDPKRYDIENEIRNDREWFRFMVGKARVQQKPLEEMIRRDAEFTFFSKYSSLAGKSYLDSVDYMALSIKNNPEWLALVEKKARERSISLDSMVMLDAIYSYDQLKKKH